MVKLRQKVIQSSLHIVSVYWFSMSCSNMIEWLILQSIWPINHATHYLLFLSSLICLVILEIRLRVSCKISFIYSMAFRAMYNYSHLRADPNPSWSAKSKTFLERKASKGMHQVCHEKSPDRHLYIHPRWKQFHWLYEYTPRVL